MAMVAIPTLRQPISHNRRTWSRAIMVEFPSNEVNWHTHASPCYATRSKDSEQFTWSDGAILLCYMIIHYFIATKTQHSPRVPPPLPTFISDTATRLPPKHTHAGYQQWAFLHGLDLPTIEITALFNTLGSFLQE